MPGGIVYSPAGDSPSDATEELPIATTAQQTGVTISTTDATAGSNAQVATDREARAAERRRRAEVLAVQQAEEERRALAAEEAAREIREWQDLQEAEEQLRPLREATTTLEKTTLATRTALGGNHTQAQQHNVLFTPHLLFASTGRRPHVPQSFNTQASLTTVNPPGLLPTGFDLPQNTTHTIPDSRSTFRPSLISGLNEGHRRVIKDFKQTVKDEKLHFSGTENERVKLFLKNIEEKASMAGISS